MRQITTKSSSLSVELPSSGYFYYEHDWDGIGGCSDTARLITLQSHTNLFKRHLEALKNFNKPFQLFLSISKEDAGYDAVYIHSPNPHAPFPELFNENPWKHTELATILEELLPKYELMVGEGQHNYVAFARGVGTALIEESAPSSTKNTSQV